MVVVCSVPPAGVANGPSVVIIDDEPEIVDVVCDVLQDEGIAASSCPHGKRALTCIRKKQPRVLLLDVQMPEVDGIQLFQQVRSDPATENIPVVFVTANAQIVQRQVPDLAGQRAWLLPKPFALLDLLDVVNQALAA